MDCRQCRDVIRTTQSHERDDALCEALSAHCRRCPQCARFAIRTGGLQALLGEPEQQAAPPEFTRGVMAAVSGLDKPARTSWLDRLIGPLRAPAPLVSLRQVTAVAALVLMVATGSLLLQRTLGTRFPTDSPATTIAATTDVADMDKAFLDELVRRHQAAGVVQPLAEDEGMRLVSYNY